MAPDVARRLLAASLVAVGFAVLPFLRHDLGPSSAFLPTCLTAIVLCDAMTSGLLMARFLARGSSTLLGLALAYLFAALLATLHALVLPGALGDGGTRGFGPHAPAWVWAIGHAGLPLALAAALWGGPPGLRRRLAGPAAPRRTYALLGAAAVVAVVGACAAALAALGSTLPAVTSGAQLSGLGIAAGPVIVAVDVATLLVVLRRGRRGDLERRLLVTVGCLLAGTIVAIGAAHRFTFGWYLSGTLDLVASAILLAALLAAVGRVGWLGSADPRAGAVDPLTGALTRSATLVAAEHLQRTRAADRPFGLALIEVDGLRAIGDRHGALAADAVLLTVAQRLRGSLRDDDVLGRSGDEGFLALLPDTDADGVTLAIDRAVAAVRDAPAATWSHEARTTASGAIAMVAEGEDALAEALAAAEAALLRARAHGREQVVSPVRGQVIALRRAAAGPRPD
jgi:diguanylate cyclase (GGDEF)-like protein